MAKIILCSSCERKRKHQAKGLCDSCYSSKWRSKKYRINESFRNKRKEYEKNFYKENPDKMKQRTTKWKKENQKKYKSQIKRNALTARYKRYILGKRVFKDLRVKGIEIYINDKKIQTPITPQINEKDESIKNIKLFKRAYAKVNLKVK